MREKYEHPLPDNIGNFSKDPYKALCVAIIYQAAYDYKRAYARVYLFEDELALGEVNSLELFFFGEWFTFISDLDPHKLVKELRQLVREECDDYERRIERTGDFI